MADWDEARQEWAGVQDPGGPADKVRTRRMLIVTGVAVALTAGAAAGIWQLADGAGDTPPSPAPDYTYTPPQEDDSTTTYGNDSYGDDSGDSYGDYGDSYGDDY